MSIRNEFVYDGPERYREALEMEVRAEVIAEHKEQLALASFWRRLQLRWMIDREILRRIENMSSSKSLY